MDRQAAGEESEPRPSRVTRDVAILQMKRQAVFPLFAQLLSSFADPWLCRVGECPKILGYAMSPCRAVTVIQSVRAISGEDKRGERMRPNVVPTRKKY